MKKAEITDRQYPIGKFEYGQKYKIDDTRKHIRYLSRFPDELKKTVKKLDREELDTPYRKGGWTVRQVVHHLADSHLNAYIRTKLAVTEQTPIIKPYEEQLWAETEDGKRGSVKMSLKLISALHRRWMEFLESLSEDDLERGYFHPSSGRVVLMQEVIALYVWHSQHHLAHIQLVADGGAEKTAKPAKAKAEKAAPLKDEAPATKRTGINSSRSNIKRAAAPPTDEASAGKKRIRRTKEQLAADQAAEAAAKEAKAAAKAAKQAAAAAEKAAKPPVDRAAIMAKARAARASNTASTAVAAAPKEKKSAAKPVKSAQAAEPGKRVRRTQEQIAADKAAEVAAKASVKEAKSAVAAAKKAAAKLDKPPVDRAAIMAKARAARQANLAAAAAAQDQQAKAAVIATAPKEKKAPAKATPTVDPNKRIRRTQEQIAADKAAAVEAKAAAKLEKKAAAKAAKKSGDAPKRPGMSAEHMARIREARMAKRAADIAAGLIPPPKPKVERDPNAPKMSRAEILEKARASRKANSEAKKNEAKKA